MIERKFEELIPLWQSKFTEYQDLGREIFSPTNLKIEPDKILLFIRLGKELDIFNQQDRLTFV